VLLAYDSLLTLPHEVRYIWTQKFKLGTALYLLARYPTLLYLSLQIMGSFLQFTSLLVRFFDVGYVDTHACMTFDIYL
jgi:Family of unknown function (DUF6533)